jgi:hypothetical protein
MENSMGLSSELRDHAFRENPTDDGMENDSAVPNCGAGPIKKKTVELGGSGCMYSLHPEKHVILA